MKRLSRQLRIVLLFPLLVTGLLACNAVPVNNGPGEFEPNEFAPDKYEEIIRGDDIAAESLGGDLLFNLLAAEFAGVRGKMSESIAFYSAAAELSNDPQVISRAAYIALYAGENDKAIELSDRWLALKLPASQSINRIRVLAFLHLKQLEPSVDALEKLLMVEGKVQGHSVNTMTHILSKETEPQFAVQVIKRLDKKYPGDTFLLLLLAKFEANLGQLEQALQHINQLIEIDDDLADAYLVKAQIHAGLGQQLQAVEAIAIALEKRPADTRLKLQYGRMLVQLKRFDKALAHFKELNEIMPNSENVLLSLGLLSIETENNEQAKEYLQELLNLGYHNQQAHYYLGRILQQQGEDMAAIVNYERVLSGDYWLDARIRVAGLLAQSGDTEAALSQLELISSSDQTENSQIRVYLAKGEVLRAASRNKEAYSLYNTALRQSPENTDLLYARALTAEKLNLLDVAESDLKMVIMHEPENANALNALGYTLADRTERLNEAREYILKAAQLLPDDPAILDSLGWVYYRLGKYEDSIKWLTKAFEKLQDAEIAAHLGEVLWMDGQTKKARSVWKKGEKLDGNQALLRDTIERLKQ